MERRSDASLPLNSAVSYKITNAHTKTSVRAPPISTHHLDAYVSNTELQQPDLDLWTVQSLKKSEHGPYVITNVVYPIVAKANSAQVNTPIKLEEKPKHPGSWLIEQSTHGSQGEYIIAHPSNRALVWTVADPKDLSYSEIYLKVSNNSTTQFWSFEESQTVTAE